MARTEAKLLEKTTWFKGNAKRKLENKQSKYQHHPPSKKRRREKKSGESKTVKSVMFVPYTAHSELAARLRESEERLEVMTGFKLKIVEKVGMKLVDLLHKADPWAGEDCGRKRCLICETKVKEGKQNSQDCHRRNMVYMTYCRTCTERQDDEIEKKYSEK